jgi:curved DNA-binding protein CbpA
MKQTFSGKTYYDILEIPKTCGQNDILKAYEIIKQAYSPSSPALYTMFTAEEAQQLNSLIDTAFSVLSNPNRRAEYDKELKRESLNLSPETSSSSNQSKNLNTDQSSGKTVFGNYKIDLSFEEKIKSTEVFDGDFLQKIRHYKNINLEQLSEKSKISKSYILAIESHDYDSLPARVFIRGFVVQLAKMLGLNHEQVADSYMDLYTKNNKS